MSEAPMLVRSRGDQALCLGCEGYLGLLLSRHSCAIV